MTLQQNRWLSWIGRTDRYSAPALILILTGNVSSLWSKLSNRDFHWTVFRHSITCRCPTETWASSINKLAHLFAVYTCFSIVHACVSRYSGGLWVFEQDSAVHIFTRVSVFSTDCILLYTDNDKELGTHCYAANIQCIPWRINSVFIWDKENGNLPFENYILAALTGWWWYADNNNWWSECQDWCSEKLHRGRQLSLLTYDNFYEWWL